MKIICTQSLIGIPCSTYHMVFSIIYWRVVLTRIHIWKFENNAVSKKYLQYDTMYDIVAVLVIKYGQNIRNTLMKHLLSVFASANWLSKSKSGLRKGWWDKSCLALSALPPSNVSYNLSCWSRIWSACSGAT